MTAAEIVVWGLVCFVLLKLSGIRTELKRIADFCERAEKRMENR